MEARTHDIKASGRDIVARGVLMPPCGRKLEAGALAMKPRARGMACDRLQ